MGKDGAVSYGGKLKMSECEQGTSDQWTYDFSLGFLKKDGYCLKSWEDKSGGSVYLKQCDWNDDGQKWVYDENTHQIKHSNGRCLDGYDDKVQIWRCHTSFRRQNWGLGETVDEAADLLAEFSVGSAEQQVASRVPSGGLLGSTASGLAPWLCLAALAVAVPSALARSWRRRVPVEGSARTGELMEQTEFGERVQLRGDARQEVEQAMALLRATSEAAGGAERVLSA